MADDLKILRDQFTHDEAEWRPIREEGTTDMRFVAGDPWDPKDRREREKKNRVCISADELSQYVNQVVNEVRANKRAVKFTPNGNGATDQSAVFYADKMREIEYRSRAQIAYTTAFENCVQRSFGFCRVNKRYAHAHAVHMDLWIDPVPNPNLITPGSDALMPDLSDMTTCWVREQWSLEEYNAKFTKNKFAKVTGDLLKSAFGWFREDNRVFVGERWTITTKQRTLLIVQPPDGTDPIGVFDEDYAQNPAVGTVLRTRKVDDPRVTMQLTNGVDILEENEWEGKYIPIIGCLGKVLYVSDSGEEKRKILSMIRLARDPQMLYAYLLTCEAEVIGDIPRFPYFVRKGSLDQKNLNLLAASLHEPVAAIEVAPYIEGMAPGSSPEFPERNPYEPPLQQIEVAKEAARRAIQAAMGQSPLPTAAQRRNEKSGVALKHIDALGQKGSFHFTDHYLDMITQVGVVIEDLMDKAAYDATRSTGIRKDDDTASIIRINDPADTESTSTTGDHLVTVSTGQSFDSERESADEFAGDLLQSHILQMLPPPVAMKVIAKSIKLKNLGPIGDQIAEAIDPQPGKDGKPTVEQLGQQLQQLHGQAQQMGQALQEAQSQLATKQIEADGKLKVAHLQESFETIRNRESNETKLAVAELGAKVDRLTLFLEERARLGVQDHEQALAAADAGHEAGLAGLDHAHTQLQGQQDHSQALDQNAQGAQIASDQMAQQAAQQPTNGAGA